MGLVIYNLEFEFYLGFRYSDLEFLAQALISH